MVYSNVLIPKINYIKKLVKSDAGGNAQYTTLKKEFNIFKNTLRRNINEANRLYYMRTT